MEGLVGMRVRDRAGRSGLVAAVVKNELRLHWTNEGVLTPIRERLELDSSDVEQVEVLTLTEGWRPLSEGLETAAPRTLIEDLESLLSEPGQLDEVGKSGAGRPGANNPARRAKAGSGKSLEKKSREKRRSRKTGGGGHNPFKTKRKLGPGPRAGTNSQTQKWKCSCPTPYKCLCKAGKRRKVVRIKRGYKKDYNHEYKAWRKNQKF